jgi:hypothetical protein
MHFTAEKLHKTIFEKVKNSSRITIVNRHVKDPEQIDSDFVMVCTGSPSSIDSNDYATLNHIPVNSVYVVQCE